MLDILICRIVDPRTDEKEEIDLPVLRLTPEPVMPPDTPAGDSNLASPSTPTSSPSKDSLAAKDRSSSSHPLHPSSPNAIGKALSTVSGVRAPLTHTNSMNTLPAYGVDVETENELSEVVQGVDMWGMDMFRVRDLSDGHPLLTIFYTILKVSLFLSL